MVKTTDSASNALWDGLYKLSSACAGFRESAISNRPVFIPKVDAPFSPLKICGLIVSQLDGFRHFDCAQCIAALNPQPSRVERLVPSISTSLDGTGAEVSRNSVYWYFIFTQVPYHCEKGCFTKLLLKYLESSETSCPIQLGSSIC
jgi:hypothetical protein